MGEQLTVCFTDETGLNRAFAGRLIKAFLEEGSGRRGNIPAFPMQILRDCNALPIPCVLGTLTRNFRCCLKTWCRQKSHL